MFRPRTLAFPVMLALALAAGFVPSVTADSGGMTARSLDMGLYTAFSLRDSRSDPVEPFHRLGFDAHYANGPFRVALDFSVINDERYTPAEPDRMQGYRFDFHEGIVELDFDPVVIRGGRTQADDEIDSPYSLFHSGYEDVFAPVTLELSYEDDFFFYRSRWIELNRNSQYYGRRRPVFEGEDIGDLDNFYPWEDVAEQDGGDGDTTDEIIGYTVEPFERGGNYTVLGVKPGDWRIGFQESVVYINQSFHPEYFLSPLPAYFTQLFISEGDKPWRQREDENLHMGIFAEYTRPGWAAYGQFLLGDINLNFLSPRDETQPQKWAWSFGGWLDTDIGRFGLYHGGATRYTFQSTSSSRSNPDNFSTQRYEYTYWPAVEFPPDRPEADRRMIDYRENYIGYQYGENNLALMATWEDRFDEWAVDAMIEGVVSGSKSPANPWHDNRRRPGTSENPKDNAPHYIHLLDEWPLEWTVRLGSSISRSFGPWDLTASVLTGGVFNELELRAVDNEYENPEPRLYAPGDTSRPLFQLSLGARYNFSWSP